MRTQYYCKNENRREAVRAPIAPSLNGIDYLEVTAVDQKTLRVYFIHPLPGQANPVPAAVPALTTGDLLIEGGVRIKNIQIVSVNAIGNVLDVVVDNAGDFSTYTLRLVTSATNLLLPAGFDPQLSSVAFSFKVNCPTDFDCKTETFCLPKQWVAPEINYLAKDYSSFRRLMLDRLSLIMPGWQDRNAADIQMVLVEMLAYTADYLSYYQDAVATEAYLGTARRRISARRHARLLDYQVSDGVNARVWIAIEVDEAGAMEGQVLPSGTMLLTRGSDETIAIAESDLEKALNEGPTVFETMHEIKLWAAHNTISFYTWSDSECCLPTGSTQATLLDDPERSIDVGDVLLFEEVISPTTGSEADADLTHRHAVRLTKAKSTTDPLTTTPVLEIEWHADDALPFPLCLSAKIETAEGGLEVKETSIARGNILLADQGRTIASGLLSPDWVPDEGNYRPYLQSSPVTFRVSYEEDKAREDSATVALIQDPQKALPAVTLNDGEDTWSPRFDLLASDRFAPEFVVEVERDGSAQIRFGDDVMGKQPSAGTTFTATYRIGNGREGNIGAEALQRIVLFTGGITSVRNPMAAAGGTDGETLEEIRQYAPQAFRTQERAVTEADYMEVAERHSGVQKAAAMFRWTGSWHTVFVAVDRKGGYDVDAAFEEEIRSHLERYRMAGYDLEISAPVFVPLDIAMIVCVYPSYLQSDVQENLLEVFSSHAQANGGNGFFHSDNLTFGQPVYLSQLYKQAMDVKGIASVVITRFQQWGKNTNNEIENGVLTPASMEIVRLDNDPNFPENGQIVFTMQGGL